MLICSLALVSLQATALEGGILESGLSESAYVVNQEKINKGAIEFSLSRADQQFAEKFSQGSSNYNAFRLGYVRPLNDFTSMYLAAQFMSKSISYDIYNQSNTVSGLGDFELGVKSGTVFEIATMTYGADVSISPGSAQIAYKGFEQRDAGNNFSGMQTAAPYIGAESYVEEIALGARFISKLYSTRQIENDPPLNSADTDATGSFHLEGFVEMPVHKKVNLGLVASLGRKDLDLSKYFEPGNENAAKIYGTYQYDKNAMAIISLSSLQQNVPYEKNDAAISIGLRQNL